MPNGHERATLPASYLPDTTRRIAEVKAQFLAKPWARLWTNTHPLPRPLLSSGRSSLRIPGSKSEPEVRSEVFSSSKGA